MGDDSAAQFREALRDAIDWANDLDARLTREDATVADVEAHGMKITGAAPPVRAVADSPG